MARKWKRSLQGGFIHNEAAQFPMPIYSYPGDIHRVSDPDHPDENVHEYLVPTSSDPDTFALQESNVNVLPNVERGDLDKNDSPTVWSTTSTKTSRQGLAGVFKSGRCSRCGKLKKLSKMREVIKTDPNTGSSYPGVVCVTEDPFTGEQKLSCRDFNSEKRWFGARRVGY